MAVRGMFLAVLVAGFALSAAAVRAQQHPDIGTYPPALGSSPPQIGGHAPAPLLTPRALDQEKTDYCRNNPNGCSVRPPTTPDLILKQTDDRTRQLNQAPPPPKPAQDQPAK